MAEAFGLAAGIVGVVSLVGQLADGIVSLRYLRESYKEARDTIDCLIKEFETLGRLLDSIDTTPDFSVSLPADQALLDDCKQICKESHAEISDVLIRLQDYVNTKSSRGAAKYVLQKPTLQDWIARTGRARSNLTLAYDICIRKESARKLEELKLKVEASQCDLQKIKDEVTSVATSSARIISDISAFNSQLYTAQDGQRTLIQTMLDQNYESLKSEISTLIEQRLVDFERSLGQVPNGLATITQEIQRVERIIRNYDCHIHADPSLQSRSGFDVTLHTRSIKKPPYQLASTDDETQQAQLPIGQSKASQNYVQWIRVWLPHWFVERQWSISVDRALPGWKCRLKLHNNRPDNAQIFEACATGDVPLIQSLLSSGRASLSDRTERGLSLLHIAAFAHQVEVCHLLVAQGILSSALASLDESPAHFMVYLSPYRSPSMHDSISLFRFLCGRCESEIEPEDSQNARLMLSYPIWSRYDHLVANLKLHQPPSVLHTSDTNPEYWTKSAEAFRQDIIQWPANQETWTMLAKGPGDLRSLLHFAALHFSQTAFTSYPPSSNLWRRICIEAIEAGADLHGMLATDRKNLTYKTPLAASPIWLAYSLWDYAATKSVFTQVINRWLDMWTETLREADINVYAYISKENVILQAASREARRLMNNFSDAHVVSIFATWLYCFDGISVNFDGNIRIAYTYSIGENDWDLFINPPLQQKMRSKLCKAIPDIRGVSTTNFQIPGSWIDIDSIDSNTAQRSSCHPERVAQVRDDLSNNGTLASGCHQRSWLCMHDLFNGSPGAAAYKQLRLNPGELAFDEQALDFGHGPSCHCLTCDGERRQFLVRTAERIRKLRRIVDDWRVETLRKQRSRVGSSRSGGGGGCGFRGCPAPPHFRPPRDSGDKPW